MKSSVHNWMVVVILLVVAMMLDAPVADARIRHRDLADPGRDYTQGGFQLYAGFGGQGYEIEDNDYEYLDEFDSEGLFFLGAAVGLDRNFALYFEGAGSEHETALGDMTFGYAHVGLKYVPQTGYRNLWQPYGKVSLGGMFLLEDDRPYEHDDNGYVGPSLGLGVGVDRFLGRRTAIFGELGLLLGSLDHRIIDGDDYELRDEIGVSSGRLLFGLRFRL